MYYVVTSFAEKISQMMSLLDEFAQYLCLQILLVIAQFILAGFLFFDKHWRKVVSKIFQMLLIMPVYIVSSFVLGLMAAIT